MSLGLVGRKIGMTRIFAEDGASVPVTVLDMSNNRVSQVKSADVDGYDAIQVAFGTRKASRINKSVAGHLAKAGVDAARGMAEFRLTADAAARFQPGAAVSVEVFQPGQMVDVSGVTQGKGFAGTIKRHHFGSQRASHGNSRSHNVPGSIGQAQDPGRIFPGKRMSGHLGNVNRTIQNLEVMRVDAERQLLLIKGAVPGPRGGDVVVRPAVKGGA
jgi:large subunit ribosomal protein L3